MKENLSYTLGDLIGIEKGEKLRFRLRTNPGLDQLVSVLKSAKPEWEGLQHAISAGPNAAHGNGGFIGHLGEQHVQMVLESARSKDVILNPIKAGTRTNNFFFRRGAGGNLIAKDRNTNEDITDYDSLMLVKGLPVVGSVRLSGVRKDRRQYLGTLSNNYINKVLLPLSEHFNTNTFGFLAIVPPEMVIAGGVPELRFVRNGGIIIPIGATLEEFRAQAQLLQNQADKAKNEEEVEKQLTRLPSNRKADLRQEGKERRRERFIWARNQQSSQLK